MLQQLFSTLDENVDLSTATENMRKIVSENLPNNWKVLCIALCPTGEVLVACLQNSKVGGLVGRVGCVGCGASAKGEKSFDRVILNKLDNLLERSRQQLVGMDPEKAVHFDEKAKRKWWKDREEVDEGLGKLVEETEEMLTKENEDISDFFGEVEDEEGEEEGEEEGSCPL